MVSIHIRKSFLEFDYGNDCLKLGLVTCKQFCSLKRCGVCFQMGIINAFHVVTCFRVAQETSSCFVWRCVKNDYTQFRTLLGHKLFIVILFYKNILCFEGASSSFHVVNLKLRSKRCECIFAFTIQVWRL